MLKASSESIQDAEVKLGPMPPSQREAVAAYFQDPIATRTDWRPLNPESLSFATHALRHIHAQRIELRITRKTQFFCGFFFFILSIICTAMIVLALTRSLIMLFMLPMAALIGASVVVKLMYSVVFDVTLGYFWRGVGSGPDSAQAAAESKVAVRLADIYALQIISERVYDRNNFATRHPSYHAGSRSYLSYELNLVRRNGERVNVIDHGALGQIQSEAQEIAKLLRVPVWDACKVPWSASID